MKTPRWSVVLRAPRVFLLAGCVLLGAGTPVVKGAEPADASAPVTTHTLFMGTQISVQLGNKLYPIKDVTGSNFVVSIDGELRLVPMKGGAPHNLNVAQGLKVTTVAANLTGLTSERAYTPGNDPRMQRQREALAVSTVIGDNASLAMGKFTVAQNNFGVAINSEPRTPDGTIIQGAAQSASALAAAGESAAKAAFAAQQMADMQLSSDFGAAAYARQRAEADMARELFDAVEVNFRVSSERPLSKPWVAVVTRFREKNAKPGAFRNAIYARALESIGSRPQEVSILQGGFPPGFEIEECQVHLYDKGEEIPTEVAPKRVELTAEEAFEYLKIEYLAKHKGATLPAIPAVGKLRGAQATMLKDAQLTAVYFVRVSEEGIPGESFTDEAATVAVDPVVASAIATVRFFPALEKGKRVPGVARLVFDQLKL